MGNEFIMNTWATIILRVSDTSDSSRVSFAKQDIYIQEHEPLRIEIRYFDFPNILQSG